MKRHIALLRGINISGKNKVPMAELKKCFEAAGFLEVKTWLNSGNVVFSCEEADAAAVSYTHLRAHETGRNLVCRLLLEKKKTNQKLKKKKHKRETQHK